MRNRWLALAAASILVLSACSQGASPTPGGGSPTGGSPAATGATGASGTAVLSGWQATGDEGIALTQALLAAQNALPDVQIDYQPVAGDYRTVMITKFASTEVPDALYVNAEYAPEWIREGFLAPLDDYIAKAGVDTSKFYPGYLDTFKGTDGKIYGLPKDGNTLAMGYNTDIVTTIPTTLDELVSTATALKGQQGLTAPMCFNAGLDRGLAFIYAQGGSLLTGDGTAAAIDSAESKAAVQWYLDQFKNGLAMTASDLGSSWCGEALGKKQVAIIFEGGWLDPFMKSTYPDTKYAWAEVPEGSAGRATLAYTVSYSIPADAANKDAGWELIKYLTGPEGMNEWTKGGVALPSRTDVATPEGKDILAKGSEYAKPGSGFMPGYTDVQKAFQDAMTLEIKNKTYLADPVIAATKAAVDKALNQ